MSKLDSEKLLLNNSPFSLSKSFNQYTSLVLHQTEAKNQKFIYSVRNIMHDNLVGDSLRIIQIIRNFLSNSTKFTPEGGTIQLEIIETGFTDEKANIRFVVTDSGIGISPDYMTKLFDPFEQENLNLSIKYGGTGIGMTISKSLIDLMGGTIQVESELGVGTTITVDISFPINKETLDVMEDNNEIKNYTNYDCSGKRVLIVEDNEINQTITAEFIKYMQGEAVLANDGLEAIQLFESSPVGYYDVILMDLLMPGKNGYDISNSIRRSTHPDAKTVCIIAMTADNFADRKTSYENGMNYHILKPIDITTLYSILSNIQ